MNQNNSFVDTEGRTWTFNIGPRIAAVVRGEGMDLADSDFLLKLVDDPISRLDLAWSLVKSSAVIQGVDLERFDASVIEVWEQMSAALLSAVSTYLDRMGRKASAESLRKAWPHKRNSRPRRSSE